MNPSPLRSIAARRPLAGPLAGPALLALTLSVSSQDDADALRLQSATPGTSRVEWRQLNPGNTGIVGDYSHDLFLDEDGLPWVAAYNPIKEHGGMSHFDGTRWNAVSNVDHAVIASPRFNDFATDPSGRMWIGTDDGLLRYDPEVGPASLVRYHSGNAPMPVDQVWALDVTPDGVVWLAMDNVAGGGPLGGLYRFDPATNDWTVWTTANGLPWGQQWPGWDWVNFVAHTTEPNGTYTVWFGSYEMGVATYRNGNFRSFNVEPPPAGTPKPIQIRGEHPTDAQGNLWCLTNAGLARRSPDGTWLVVGTPTGQLGSYEALSGGRVIHADDNDRIFVWDGGWQSLGFWGGDFTGGMAEAPDGTIWVSGRGGAARYQAGSWQRYRLTNTGPLGYFMRAIRFAPDGTVYMNGNAAPGVGGFQFFDGEDWTCVNTLNYGLGPEWPINSDEVDALCVRSNGKIAVAPSGGHGVFDWDGATFTQLLQNLSSIELLAEDGLGRLWAAEEYGGVYIVETDGSSRYVSVLSGLIPVSWKGSMIPDPDNPGWMWISGWSGISHTDGTTATNYSPTDLGFTLGTVEYQLSTIALNDDGTLWVGSLGLGVGLFDPATMEVVRYDMTNSTLPSDWIRLVDVAPDGTLWVSTFDWKFPYPGGISQFDGRKWRTWTQESSPLAEEQHAVMRTRAVPGGYEVWVGTSAEGISIAEVRTPRAPKHGRRKLEEL